MKKKLLAFFLAGIMLCAACAKTGEDVSPSGDSQESQTDTAAQTDADQPGTGQEESQPSSGRIPVVTVDNVRLQRWTPDNEILLAEVAWDNLSLEGEGYEKAAETVRRILYTQEEELRGTLDSYAEMAAEQYEEQEDKTWFSDYVSSRSYQITRLDTRILSVNVNDYDYSGGVHGYGSMWGSTIDLQSGVELELSRMMEDAPGFWNMALETALSELRNSEDELFTDYETYVKENLESANWYLDAVGIEFVFNPYEIGPYASGYIEVCIPYEDAADYMKPEYLRFEGEYIMPVPINREISDADGAYHVLFEHRQLQEYMWEMVLRVNGQETSLGDVFVQSAYLMRRADGRIFLIFDIDWASDDYETFVYELTAGGAVEKESVWAKLDGRNIRTDRVNLIFTVDALGTYTSQMYYTLGEEGTLTPQEDIYRIDVRSEWKGLTVIKELPVTVQGQETTLPEGSTMHVTAVDRKDTIWFEAVNPAGETIVGEIHYDWREEEYEHYIGGISEYEYFETLPYAG